MLEKQVTEIDGVAHMFLWEQCPDIAVDRDLRSEADRVVLVDPEQRRSEEHLVRVGLRDEQAVVEKAGRALAHQFPKDPPVPFISFGSPLRRPIAVYEAVVENIRSAFAATLVELRIGST